MTIEIDASGLERALTDFLVDVERESREAMTRASEIAAEKARELAPVKRGDLRSSIEPIYGIGSLLDGTLHGGVQVGGDYAEHAVFVHEGTRPHTIRARGRWMLRFQGRGGLTFRKSVSHPGTAPNPFLVQAVELSMDEINEEFAAALERATARAGFR